ncbi:hypothetical protein DFH29DRAFT_1038046 [Suillus ampliporus]|nr:hypothetical protein DFH29DRAFT_1038046 [Suillus ampliporus]
MPRSSFSSPSNASSAPNSPATNTDTRKRAASPIPILESPKKKRRAKAEQSDLEVWSNTEVPLVFEVVPMLENLEHALDRVYNASDSEPPVVRIAAQAALQVVGKYYALTDDNEVYRIAIAMCPHRKIEWFDRNPDWHESDRDDAKKLVRQRWAESYATLPSPTKTRDLPPAPLQRTSSRWAADSDEDDEEDILSSPDSIEAYLDTPRISKAELKAAGGVLQYWENAPSSVDAERAFSGGRLQVNHLQHGISSQTFKAQVAVGSWFNTPLMPDLGIATNIMRKKMGKEKEKKKEQVDAVELESDG